MFEEFRNKLVGARAAHGVWLTSLMSEEAGKWLTTVPKLAKYKFSNLKYSTQMRFRLHLEIPDICYGVRCLCSRRTVVDATGHHLVTGCGYDGHRHRIHDTVVHELTACLRYCGLWVIREELGCFKLALPHCNKRPDISINNPLPGGDFLQDGCGAKLVLDVQVTCPMVGAQGGVLQQDLSGVQIREKGRAAKKAFNGKNVKYKQIANNSGISFQPIIFESTGAMEETTVKFLRQCAKHCAEVKKIDESIIYGYITNRLSCVFQSCIADSIIARSHVINSHATRAAARAYIVSDDHVRTHSIHRSGGRTSRR